MVPPDAGARIPIPLHPDEPAPSPPKRAAKHPATPYIPDVMAQADGAEPGEATDAPESIEEQVNRLRPRTIKMQLRFLRTLLFMLLLFGRLIFWQVYMARYFPDWVSARNKDRWRKYARQFRHFAIDMGGVMIKAGQFASTRADLLPEEVIAELSGLQDKVPTVPFYKIREVIEAELGTPDTLYEWIDEEPVAAASLGQVHRARLKTGEQVVVKVQRPGVRRIVYTDMAALFIVARVAMRFGFVRRRTDAVMIVDEFGRVLLEEINYVKEIENAARFKRMFASDPGVYIPSTYPKISTERVLTLEDVTSIKLDDYAALDAAGIDRKEVARRLMDTYMKQVFEYRFFHADPHPGNIFIYPLPVDDAAQNMGKGGRPFYLIFVDFGMTGTLTRELSQGLINTLTAVLTRDATRLVQSYQQLGFLMPDADTARIEEATRRVFDEVWGMSMSDMTSMEFSVVQDIGEQFSDLLYDMPFRVPQDFVYLGRTVGILSGMATSLDPAFNPWVEIQEYVQRFVTSSEDGTVFDEIGEVIQQAIDDIITGGPQGFLRVTQRVLNQFNRLSRVENMLQQIIDGEIQVQTRPGSQHRRQLARIEAQGKRTTRTVLAGSLFIGGTLFYTGSDVTLAVITYGVAAVAYMSSWFVRQ